jgi:hypothetical protein
MGGKNREIGQKNNKKKQVVETTRVSHEKN